MRSRGAPVWFEHLAIVVCNAMQQMHQANAQLTPVCSRLGCAKDACQ
ncbi:MAG: hypothetical protein ACI9PU_001537, partial [Ascidiaceihabitans sp.]